MCAFYYYSIAYMLIQVVHKYNENSQLSFICCKYYSLACIITPLVVIRVIWLFTIYLSMFSFPYNVTNERFLQNGIAVYFVCLQCILKRTNYIVKTKSKYYTVWSCVQWIVLSILRYMKLFALSMISWDYSYIGWIYKFLLDQFHIITLPLTM